MIVKFFIFVSLLFTVNCQLYEGDSCILDGINGECKFFNECAIAKDNLKKKIRPKICGFSSGQTIVCCLSENTKRKPPTSSSYSSEHEEECQFPSFAITVKRDEYPYKSWNKCIDLADSVFPCLSQSFALNSPKFRLNECRLTAVELILGGIAAKPYEFPHMAVLGYENTENSAIEWDCGGTLISEQWIMTAAHCLYNRLLKAYVSRVRLGAGNLNAPTDSKFIFTIKDKKKHPEYNPLKVYNDIALLQLDRSVRYSASVRPACLHVGNYVKDNRAIAIGYGAMEDSRTKSNILLKVVLDKFSHEECSQILPPVKRYKQGILNSTQICYGSRTEIKDTCRGDSGSPLQIYNEGVHCTYTVIGITSNGQQCGITGVPALYTRVSAFIPWIESIVWPN